MQRLLAVPITLACLAATGVHADSRHTSFVVSATVPERATLEVLEQPALVQISEQDVARGYKDVAAQYQVESNTVRGWLLRWLPCRAFENGVYAVFSNSIGVDYDTIKPGLAMILDPFGEVLSESRALDDDVVVGLLTAEKLAQSSGRRYLRARRPTLYGKLVEPQESVTEPGWRGGPAAICGASCTMPGTSAPRTA